MNISKRSYKKREESKQKQKSDFLSFLEANEGATFHEIKQGVSISEDRIADLLAEIMFCDGLVNVSFQQEPARYYTVWGFDARK
jgi:hypothetical protein